MTIAAGQQALAADILVEHNADGTHKAATLTSASIISHLLLGVCEGRLTLTSGTPITTADVTGATSIFFAPFKGDRIALFDGASLWTVLTFSEIAIALGTLTSDLPYDLFAYNNSGAVAFDSPLAWTNGTTRATALTTQNGVLVKSGQTTRRYIGTFYTTSTTQTEDSAAKRFLWNYYNRLRRPMRVLEATNSWTYTTAAYRQANGAAANQLDFVVGYSEDPVEAEVLASATSSGAIGAAVAVGLDSTSVASSQHMNLVNITTSINASLLAKYSGFPGAGRHFLAWLEYSQAAGTTTWYGDNNAPTLQQNGIYGNIWG